MDWVSLKTQGRANPAFSKPCLCLSDTRHFRFFLSFLRVWGVKPCFQWVECKFVIFAVFVKTAPFWRGGKTKKRRFAPPWKTGVSEAMSNGVSLGPLKFGPRALGCPESVPRVSPECQKGNGVLSDTPGPGARRAPETRRGTLSLVFGDALGTLPGHFRPESGCLKRALFVKKT